MPDGGQKAASKSASVDTERRPARLSELGAAPAPALGAVHQLHRQAGNHAFASSIGSGVPLASEIRAEMEKRFGSDFSNVRIHSDSSASESAAALNAKAYAVGDNIVVNGRRHSLNGHDGRRLLAHELAHVVQQRGGGVPPDLQSAAPHEQEAARAASNVAAGAPAGPIASNTGVGVACEPEDNEFKTQSTRNSSTTFPKEDAFRVFESGPQYWLDHTPDFASKPPLQLMDEAAQIQEWLDRQNASAKSDRSIPDHIRLAQTRDQFLAEAKAKTESARRGPNSHSQTVPANGLPSKPRVLRERTSIDASRTELAAKDYDEIVEYMAHGKPSKAERTILRLQLQQLAPSADRYLNRQSRDRHSQSVTDALIPREGEGAEQLSDMAARIDSIAPVPGKPGQYSVVRGHETILMSEEEVNAIRTSALHSLEDQRGDIGSKNVGTLGDYKDLFDRSYDKHPWVGFISSLYSGEAPAEWRESLTQIVAASNGQLGQFDTLLKGARDPWQASSVKLAPIAERLASGERLSDNARRYFDYKEDKTYSGTKDALSALRGLKALGNISASVAFSPLGSALYSAVSSAAVQHEEISLGMRDHYDRLGIVLDAGVGLAAGAASKGIMSLAREAPLAVRLGAYFAGDRAVSGASTAVRQSADKLLHRSDQSWGSIARSSVDELTDVKQGIINMGMLGVGNVAHAPSNSPRHSAPTHDAAHSADSAATPEVADESKLKGEGQRLGEDQTQRSQANMTVLTQRPPKRPTLHLPVDIINDPNQGKGTLSESIVPFELYSGPDWNHLGGGETTKSSRTSLARDAGWGPKSGLDFLVEHRKTGRLVIGEQKAVDSNTFDDATAITQSLEKNVAHAQERLQKMLDTPHAEGGVHPEEAAHLREVVAKLEATREALKNQTELPPGVVFELTNIGGKGKSIGKPHVDMLADRHGRGPNAKKAYKPEFVEHLLSRTFVRDPRLAREKGRAADGLRGTDSDPDVVPAEKLLTGEAKDALARRRAGRTEEQWEKDKVKRKLADKEAAQDARKAKTAERGAALRDAQQQAKKQGAASAKQKLKQLREERSQEKSTAPKTKRQRQQADAELRREAKKHGKQVKEGAVKEFLSNRKAQDTQERNAKKAEELQRKQQRQTEREANAKRAAQEKSEAAAHESARKQAEAAGSLKVPETLSRMNAEARRQYESQVRNANMGKAAHYTNQAAAGLRAVDTYEEQRAAGKGRLEAGADAALTYLSNTNPILGAIETATQRQKKDASGQQYYGDDAVDAWLGTIGETAGGYLVPGKGWDQLLNAGANLTDAVDDHLARGRVPDQTQSNKATVRTGIDLAAEMTPSRMASQTFGGGLRAWYDVARATTGDLKGVEKFGEDAVRGRLGSIIQPWAMAADFVGNLGGSDAGTALDKTLKKTEGTTLKKLGDASGDAMYELGQSKNAKAGIYGPQAQIASMVLGMTSSMIAGDSFEKAAGKEAELSKGTPLTTVGEVLGDAAFDTVQKGKEIINEDLPAAKKRAADALHNAKQHISDLWDRL